MMSAADMTSVQADVKVNLYRKGDDIEAKPISSFYNAVQTADPLKVANHLGEIGINFRSFASLVDLDHPEVGHLFGDKIDTLGQLFEIGQFAATIKAQGVFSTVLKSVVGGIKEELKDLNYRNIASVTNLIRLLKSEQLRTKGRINKGVLPLEMTHFYRRGVEGWNETPDNFAPFVRHSTASSEEVKRIQDKRDKFTKLGMTSLSIEVGRSIDAYEKMMADSFIGFRRLPLTASAIMLAKAHGFTYNSYNNGIVVAKKDINLWDFGKKKASVYDSPKKAVAPEAVTAMNYCPRIYPFSKLAHLASPDCLKIIEHLEHMPEAKGKPVFDHYIVLVPSFNLNDFHHRNTLFNKAGESVVFKSSSEAQVGMDEMLITEKCVNPIILAERDNKCYFISYFE